MNGILLKQLSASLVLLGLALAWAGAVIGPSAQRVAGVQQARSSDAARTESLSAVEAQVEALVKQMTLDEKIEMLGGSPDGFHTAAIPRLGIPALKMSDGPMGLRNDGPSTAFPAGIGLAASWDKQMALRMGQAMGLEARARGVHILLAPAVNIQRVAINGRNFEYYGEDPYLAGQTAVGFIRGVQSEGVIATVKHFAANNQEYQRRSISAEIDERTLHEIYLPAFKAAIQQGNVWAVMAAYNRVNGTYAAEDKSLLIDILKKRWGFRGLVMSDWGATHDGVAAALGGLDLEMPRPEFMNRATLLPAIQGGEISETLIDDKIRHILRAAMSMGFLARPQQLSNLPLYSGASSDVALQSAREGIVLLQNRQHLLPLDSARIHSIAVFGPNANPAVTGGGGSSRVVPFRATSVLEGLMDFVPAHVRVDYLPFKSTVAQSTTSGSEHSQQGPGGPSQAPLDFRAEAALAARDDVAVVCVGYDPKTESEGSDRTFGLPPGQDELIETVAHANPRTIVVLNSGGAVDMTGWIAQIGSLLEAWYPGQEGGRAIAEILLGSVDPSGKLPATFERRWGDAEADRNYPGENGRVFYRERIFVGYRYFDRATVKPLFPFGYGLSYTTFTYRGLTVTPEGSDQHVAFDVKNTGSRTGVEVAEIYVHEDHPAVPRPVKELKQFARVLLMPGQTRHVQVDLDRSAFSYYDSGGHRWKADPGQYEILVGSSSRDIRLRSTISLTLSMHGASKR
ncbi:MAG TPA: glycoside hydrolase family 3 C-terminal domain-containing protein [Terriglobia bacterium]|nr:glycoside hydrolase family 3 C-terminal domain-containing protein [Terriglobia bacterium]